MVQNKPEKKAERNWSQVFSRFQKIVVFKIKIEFTLDIQNRSSGPVIIVIGKFHFPHQHTSKYFYKYRLKIG